MDTHCDTCPVHMWHAITTSAEGERRIRLDERQKWAAIQQRMQNRIDQLEAELRQARTRAA